MAGRRLSVSITTQRLVSETHRVPREDLAPRNGLIRYSITLCVLASRLPLLFLFEKRLSSG
jgi:hypothetical protein